MLPARIDLDRHPAWSEGVEWVLPVPGGRAARRAGRLRATAASRARRRTRARSPAATAIRRAAGTIALVGDSKALQWLPALDTWASRAAYRLVTYVKSSCPLATSPWISAGPPYPSCRDWNAAVPQRLVDLRPGLVVTSQVRHGARPTLGGPAATRELMAAGLQRTWQTLLDAAVPVAVVGDTPQTGSNVYACVAEHPDRLQDCEYDRAAALGRSALLSQVTAVRCPGRAAVNASGTVSRARAEPRPHPGRPDRCGVPGRTPGAHRWSGNVLIYRSGSHLTKTYVDSLSGRFGTRARHGL